MRSTKATLALVKMTFWQLLRTRRFVALLVLGCIPLALVAYWAYSTSDNMMPYDFYSDFTLIVYLQLVMPIIALINGTALIRDEIENKTISYLVTRSFSRRKLVIGRFIGYVPVAFILISAPITASYLIVGLTKGGISANLDILGAFILLAFIGVVVYGAFFNLMGVTFKHPLMIGLLFTFIWEVMLANMPGRIPYVTIMFYLRSFAAGIIDAGTVPFWDNGISHWHAAAVLVGIALAAVALAMNRFAKKSVV